MRLRADPFVFKLDHPQPGQLIIKGDSKGEQGICVELSDLIKSTITSNPNGIKMANVTTRDGNKSKSLPLIP